MAVPVIEKDKRPKIAPENKDGDVIVLSAAQCDPHLADPNDFVILTSEEAATAEYIGDGQHGTTAAECRKIKEASAADRGKSRLSK